MRRWRPLLVAAALLAVGALVTGGTIGYPDRAPAFQVSGDDPGELWEAEPFGPLADDPQALAEIRARLSGSRRYENGVATRWSATPDAVQVLYADPTYAVALVDHRFGALSWPRVRHLRDDYSAAGDDTEHVVAVTLDQMPGVGDDRPGRPGAGRGVLLFAPRAAVVTTQGPVDVLADGRAVRSPAVPLQQRPGVWWVPRPGRLDVTVTDDGWTWRRAWPEDGGSFDPATDALVARRGSPECGRLSEHLILDVSWRTGLAVPLPHPDLLWCGRSPDGAMALLALPAAGGGQVLLGVELAQPDGGGVVPKIELATGRAAGDPRGQGVAWRRPDGGLVLVGPDGAVAATLEDADGAQRRQIALEAGGAVLDAGSGAGDVTAVVFRDAAGTTLASPRVTVPPDDPFSALGAPDPYR